MACQRRKVVIVGRRADSHRQRMCESSAAGRWYDIKRSRRRIASALATSAQWASLSSWERSIFSACRVSLWACRTSYAISAIFECFAQGETAINNSEINGEWLLEVTVDRCNNWEQYTSVLAQSLRDNWSRKVYLCRGRIASRKIIADRQDCCLRLGGIAASRFMRRRRKKARL